MSQNLTNSGSLFLYTQPTKEAEDMLMSLKPRLLRATKPTVLGVVLGIGDAQGQPPHIVRVYRLNFWWPFPAMLAGSSSNSKMWCLEPIPLVFLLIFYIPTPIRVTVLG
jgi:hypothetical protein